MDPNHKLSRIEGECFSNPGWYRCLVGTLNYLTFTRSNVAYALSVVSPFMETPQVPYWDSVIHIIRYVK